MEILATELVTNDVNVVGTILFTLLAIVVVLWMIGTALDKKYLAFVILLLALCALVFGIYVLTNEEPTTTYEVLIHDISEFDYERYEIIEQRGKIFVVKERLNDE